MTPPKKSHHSERSDRRGFGESFPRAPLGLSRSDWGLEVSCAEREATEGVSGNPFPVPPGAVAKRLGVGGIVRGARSDRRGFGESFPRAPLGLSRSDWGLEVSGAEREARSDQGLKVE